jgi:hypothetical protein
LFEKNNLKIRSLQEEMTKMKETMKETDKKIENLEQKLIYKEKISSVRQENIK